MKKRVYIETSVISYLASRPSRDIIRLGKQRLTAEWWEERHKWELFITPTVNDEICRGDADAVKRRKHVAESIPLLPLSPQADALADLIIAKALLPKSSLADATHLALAVVHNADYLLTWNQRHLDNSSTRERMVDFFKQQGMRPVYVLTPERLLEETS